MNKEKIETLTRIYNTMLLINTKGEDTIIMSDCLKALRSFIASVEQEQVQNQQEEE